TAGAWLGFGGLGMPDGLGVPQLGGTGIAIGCIIEAYLTCIFYMASLAVKKDLRAFEFFNLVKKIPNSLKQLKEILKLSAPISFSITVEMAVSLALGVFSGALGKEQQSAINY